jgi:uncharacterized membrane protein YecN with MAPEG domain
MTLEALLLIFLLSVRNEMTKSITDQTSQSEFSFRAIMFCMKIISFVSPIGLLLLSVVTLDDNFYVHILGAVFFFFGMIAYYIFADFSLTKTNQNVTILTRLLSWSSLLFLLLYMIILGAAKSNISLTFGAIFQYLTALTIFIKILLFPLDIAQPHLTFWTDNLIV